MTTATAPSPVTSPTRPKAQKPRNPLARFEEWQHQRLRAGKRTIPTSFGNPTTRLIAMLLVSLLLLIATFFGALSYLNPDPVGERVDTGRLTELAEQGLVQEAVFFDFDSQIVGTYTSSGGVREFTSNYFASDANIPQLVAALSQAGVPYDIESQPTKEVVQFGTTYLLPLVILANLFALIFVGARGGGGDAMGGIAEFSGIGKGGDVRGESTVTFADIAGAKEAELELREVRDYLTDPEKFAAAGAKAPKGVMMFGPPGCGKTLMARAVAGEAGVPFFSVSGAEFVESLVGVGAARVRDLFKQVRAVAPAILFIDEIDAAGRRRGGVAGGQEEREQTLNQMLVEMDGFDPTAGVVVIGATNRPDILDPALMRPGRFDRQVTVEPPDLEGREEILRLYAKKRPLEDDVDFTHLARRTPGFTGADLASVVNEAALLSVRGGVATISMKLMEEAIIRVSDGPQKRGHLMSPAERQRAAYHESAHLIVGAVCGRLGDRPKVTIQAHGKNLGSVGGKGWAERTLITRSELFDELTTLMAGVAVEEQLLGESSTGVDGDLERATSVAQMMIGRYGMSQKMGKVRLLHLEGEFLGGGGDVYPADFAQGPVLAAFHEEVRALVDLAQEAATAILTTHRALLDGLVAQLLDHESLEGDPLKVLIDPLRPPETLVLDPAPALTPARADGRRGTKA